MTEQMHTPGAATPTPWEFKPVGEKYHVSVNGGWFMEISMGYPSSEMAYPDDALAEFEGNIDLMRSAVNSFASSQERIAQLEKALTRIARIGRDRSEKKHYRIDDIVEEADAALGAQPLEPEPEGEWITWAGGECPVDAGQRTEVKSRGGEFFTGNTPEIWAWWHRFCADDIIAYRIVGAAK